jgi:hypothetical protein
MRKAAVELARVTLCAAFAFGGAAAASSEIEVRVGGCRAGVELVASDAPLSAVLQRLSQALGFKLHLQERVDVRVDMNLSAPAPELLTRLLSPHGRYIVATRKDPRCDGQARVSAVWLLPGGASAKPSQADAKAAAKPKPVPVTQTATPEQLRAAEERSRRLKAAYDAHVATHGGPPDGEEQEEARP